jgi:hypothetical protein
MSTNNAGKPEQVNKKKKWDAVDIVIGCGMLLTAIVFLAIWIGGWIGVGVLATNWLLDISGYDISQTTTIYGVIAGLVGCVIASTWVYYKIEHGPDLTSTSNEPSDDDVSPFR